MKRSFVCALLATSLTWATGATAAADGPSPTRSNSFAHPQYGAWGVDLTARDTSIDPGNDFDSYANGTWRAQIKIPDDQPAAAVFFDLINRSQDQLHTIMEGASPTSPIGAMYRSFMDEARVEFLGAAPLATDLGRVARVSSKPQFAQLLGRTHGGFGSSIFGLSVNPDPKRPSTKVLYVNQSGIGLPDRDYYLLAKFKPQRDAYRTYVQRTLANIHDPDPAVHADQILSLEVQIARVSWAASERRDVDKTNNPMTLTQLQAYAPAFPWRRYLAGAKITKAGNIIVGEKSAIKAIGEVFAATPLATLKAWQSFHIVDDASPYLSSSFVDSQFAFKRTLNGVSTLSVRWKRAATLMNSSLGEALGRAYVDLYFPQASKIRMEALVTDLKAATARRLQASTWMSPATKAEALSKLERMKVMVGYPEKWRDYSGLKILPADLYGNVERSRLFEWDYQLAGLYRNVDSGQWQLTPQTVNAYNGGQENKIVFPAAILQPPIFDPAADDAVNYGAIGATIGHEISHGFDDQGRKVDASGSVRDWWAPQDAQRFESQAARFGTQYQSYEPVPGMHIDGNLTMGENIADLAGVLVALDAYHASLGGKAAPVIDGLSGDQRFFLAFAQIWRAKQRENAIRQQLASNPHSPPRFRIIGPLRNIDAWYEAFHVQPGATYYLRPQDRVRIW